jgi:alkylation response protein AidB-like acyl-CoA dehydrogenase
MDYKLTDTQRAWRDDLRAFFAREFTADMREQIERENSDYSEALYQALARAGYTGLSIPKEFGGLEHGYLDIALFDEEAMLAGVPHGVTSLFSGSVHFAAISLIRIGTADQRRRFLPGILEGRFKFTQGFTEPGCGSDLAAVQTFARDEGDEFVVSGQKIFNTAHLATHMIAVVRSDREAPKHKGISLLIIDLGSDGVTLHPTYTMRGWRRNIVTLDEVRVPRINLLGRLHRGWYDLMSVMDLERSGVRQPAERRAALKEILDYVRSTERDGRPLIAHPEVRSMIADLYRDLVVGALLSYRVVWMQETGQDATSYASYQKIFNSEAAERMANAAMEVVGPGALVLGRSQADRRWAPLGRLLTKLYQDCRIWQIAGGTSEIQRNIIAQRVLGLPRE